jgi:phosphocarrier protein HPr
MKLEQKVKIKNSLGLHARPATLIVKLLQKSYSQVFFTYRGETVNARSIMSILMLAAGKNATILISVEGEDAESTLTALVDSFNSAFGEESNAV